ncbi:MFS transporter [Streptomyces sp. NPDC002490]|uniref:MFS transporter n=1 Tax=Streptomyces sp. NPDC002490 TaxID=3154416 RepID=UPI003317D109
MSSGVRGSAATAVRWRGGFGRLWAAAVLSRFGDALRTAALPLLAATLTDEPLLIATVTASGYLPWLVFGLLGGALADRLDQRRAMIHVDLVRALLVGAFAVAVALDRASIGLLVVLALALTTLQTLFDNAATALLPALVPADALASANARLMTGQQIAGGLIAVPLVPLVLTLGAAAPYAVDALTYLLAAALLTALRPVDPPDRPSEAPGAGLRAEVVRGVRSLWRDGVLRALCTATALTNLGVGALVATLIVLVTDGLHAGEREYALALTGYAVGSLAAGFLARRLGDRLGALRTLLCCAVGQGGALVVAGAAPGIAVLVAALVAFGFLGLVWNVQQTTVTQLRTPPGSLGRVSAAFRTLSIGAGALGALLGGVAATGWGPRAPAHLAAATFALAALVLLSRVRGGAGAAADRRPGP